MLTQLNPIYRATYTEEPASLSDLALLKAEVPEIPAYYLGLVSEATDIYVKVKKEFIHRDEGDRYILSDVPVIQLMNPIYCMENTKYLRENRISSTYPDVQVTGDMIPFGIDGGDNVFILMDYDRKPGLYISPIAGVGFDEPIWIAPSLKDFLADAVGIDVYLRDEYGHRISQHGR
ncbi:MAG: hypothetical protein JXB07_04945 [Anaerolineae bacterium]|nr:hypothetical protein [Anaerolineae bacterium]